MRRCACARQVHVTARDQLLLSAGGADALMLQWRISQ
jgi:hypothetical protein